MKGKGYKMSATVKGTPKVHEWPKAEEVESSCREEGGTVGKKQKRPLDETAENIGSMFIDDCIWSADSGNNMEKMLRMHETFCDFHNIFIVFIKCSLFS